MTTYAVERWRDLKEEMLPMLVMHWREIALNHADVPLDIDDARYDALDESGGLQIITARRDGVLIGYHVAILSTHLHYKSTLHGFTDVYYIAPEARHGITGMRLFQRVEQEMRARGVKKLFTATKLHLDQGPLFERLGYAPIERMYAKIL